MYNYRPVNSDELELREGDTVYVLEQCDDGWVSFQFELDLGIKFDFIIG